MHHWKVNAVSAAVAALGIAGHGQSFTNGLVVGLSFDGHLVAQAGTTNHGTVFAGTPVYTTGVLGQAVRFSNDASSTTGPSDWAVSLGDLEWVYTNDFTVSVWMRAFESKNASILGNRDWSAQNSIGWAVSTHNGRNLSWRTPDETVQNTDLQPPLLEGAWHLLTAVFDRTGHQVHIYLDGSQVQEEDYLSTDLAPLTPSPSFATLVGASGPGYYAGRADIDDLGIWDRALTPTEVALIHSYGLDGTNLALNFAPPPVITLNPADTTVEAGDSTSLTGAAFGQDIAYQWLFYDEELPGETADTLIVNNVQSSHAGFYRLIATNASGSVTSAPATLTVTDSTPPTLTCAGDKSVECGSEWSFDLPTADDNSDGELTITVVSTLTNAPGCGGP